MFDRMKRSKADSSWCSREDRTIWVFYLAAY